MSNPETSIESIVLTEEQTPLIQKDFQLISTTLHHVDFKSNSLDDATDKLKGNDISKFISDLIDIITSKGDKREFNFPSNTSEVISATYRLIQKNSLHNSLATDISKRLLIKETKVQEDRDRKKLKHELRKGSLIQALIKRYDKYEYLLLKIEHDSYFDLEVV